MIITPPTITRRTRPEIASFVIETIEAAGVRVPSSSRLRRMHNLLHSGKGAIAPDHPDYETAVESERDLQLLAFAFDQLADTKVTPVYRELLRKLIRDSVLPQHDRGNSQGRDAGFEVYVGAICNAARFLPVSWEEPDVTCHLDQMKLAVAAKRVKNIDRIPERIKKAVEQIDGSGILGLIVLDVGVAFNRNNDRIRNLSDEVFWSEYKARFDITWENLHSKVQAAMSRGNVLGVIVHDYHIRFVDEGPQLTGMTIRVPAEQRPAVDRKLFDRFSTLYSYGLPNQSTT